MTTDGRSTGIAGREEFESLLRPVLGLAYRYAVRLANDRDAGMDLVQDASVAAFRAFAQFEKGTNFCAWYLKILTHRYYQHRRGAAARTPTVSLDEAPDLFLYGHAKRLGVRMEGDPAAFVFDRADGDAVCEALARLPDEYRVVATLHLIGEMPYDECAQVLGVPVGTVRSRLHRARRALQTSLWRLAEERGYVPEETP